MASTDFTEEHYARPEVKAAILRYCQHGAGARALNADEHWYKSGKDPKTVMLRGPADYDATIERGRTLYATLDILEPEVFERAEAWDDALHEPVSPIGDLSNCIAFSLSTDIDGIGDIRTDLSVKEAVEDAAQFHCDYLRAKGIEKSVYCLYSGGGIYVHLHHGLFAVAVGNTTLTPEDRKREYQVITKAHNRLIGDISKEFFRKYPQYIGKVKFDALNNQKRTFKPIFSIHKRHPFAVIPLDPKAIKIDFKRASLPLSDEVLAEGAAWYQTFDPSEKEPLVALIRAHMEDVRKDTREHSTGNGTISRLPEPLDRVNFAPCMQNIIEKAQPVEGKHRALGILATYLYQMGWGEDAAFDLWISIANRCGVEPRIFETTFGRISCPLCSTMQTDTGGYPNLNLFNIGFCVPDENCKGCQWPGDYHLQKILNDECQNDAAADEAEVKAATRIEEPLLPQDVGDQKFDKEGKPAGYKLSATKAARAIVKKKILAMSEESEDIYRFDGQIYRPDGARKIDMDLVHLMGDDVTIVKLKEILRRVKNELLEKPLTFDPKPCLLGVKNGVVDLSTGAFREYRPDDLITDRIDVTYDKNAKCPRFIQFMEETVPAVVDRLMLVDWFAIHAIRLMFAYVMFLLGLGRNGKGIFERLMKRFYKEESFSEMPLEELNVKNNRFAGAALKGKRGQIVSEAGEERKPGTKRTIPTNYLKFSTGDGTIDSDQKGTIRTRFKPFYKATIDCNDMPLIVDSSPGWIERFCKANMPFKFVDNPAPDTLERKKDPHLLEKLTTDSELSGILNLILFRTPDLIRTKTIIKRSGAEMFAEYQKQSSSVKTFLELFCDYKPVSDKSKDIFLDLIFEKYEAWCDRTVADKVDGIRFGKAVKTFCKGTEPERVSDGDRKRRIYHGLSFDTNRYQAHWDHYNTIKGPLKTVTGPLGPLNEEIWDDIVEKYGDISTVIKEEMDFTPILVSMDPIAIPKIANGPDSGFNGRGGRFIGPDSDLPKTEADQQDAAREEHFKDVAEKHPLICAKCGSPLARGQDGFREADGACYCTKNGCAYPPREAKP